MKNVLSLLVFVFILSCSDKPYEQIRTGAADANFSTGTLTGIIGYIDESTGKVTLRQDEKALVTSFNSMLKKGSNIEARLEHVSIEKMSSGGYYLRGYGEKYKSTMLLQKDEVGNLLVAK